MDEARSAAELNSELIFELLQLEGGLEVTPSNKNGIGSKIRGLYLFYLQSEESDRMYPIYIGTTRDNFRNSFQEHGRNGVIHKVLSKEFSPSGGLYKLFVHEFSMVPPSTATLLKTILQEAFDFALNSENGPTRDLDHSASLRREESYSSFQAAYFRARQGICDIGKYYFPKDLVRYYMSN